MGVVYEAWDPDLGRTIALKVVAPAFTESRAGRDAYERRFLFEAKAAARLSHPGIVIVYDVGRDRAHGAYMALEYLTGATLQERLAEGPLPWRDALSIVGRVAGALHHAHANGVVHRDIKPANIMILPSGDPKILDFGIARVDTGHLTVPGEMFGTPLYMAPEQALGAAVDARSDLFSLGAVVYTLLCGRPAFQGTSVAAIVAQITHRDARPPSEVVAGLPEDVDYLVARAMAKSPSDRYADVRMFADDVEDIVADRPPRHRAGWTPPAPAVSTLVSAAPEGADLEELELMESARPLPPPAGVRRSRARVTLRLFAALMGVTGVYFILHPSDFEFWRRELPRLRSAARAYADKVAVVPPTGEAAPPPSAPPASAPAASPPAEVPMPAAVRADEPPAVSPLPQAAEPVAEPVPSLAPSPPAPIASPPPPEATPRPASVAPKRTAVALAASQLLLEVEHQSDAGTLELWVDGARVLQEKLSSHGRRRSAVGVGPGRRQIEVRVKFGRSTRRAQTSGTFKAGSTRRLRVGVLRGGPPTLEWR